MNIYNHIKSLLEANEAFYKDGKLFKNVVIEAALKLDRQLLSILIKDDSAKEIFFQDVEGILVFDKIKFQKFISNKQFLPDSYTSFKNKIGLTANRQYLTEVKEVVLDFPYKDCILEGGQRKEDQKRQEIFWNETLAPDEIDRLLEPKVLTNWKKYDKDGEHTVKDLSFDDNLIIKGNNLIALHSLKKSYKNQVKLIYIDPPYNTGNDSFQYNDSFNHSTWLTFMKNRLEVAWELLHKDGSFFIQVDDSEFAYLKVLCDEVFGRDNFRETIVLKSSTESGVNAINVKRGERLFKVKEYILFYAKSNTFRFNPFYTKAKFNKNYKYEIVKVNGDYTVNNVHKKITEKYSTFDLSAQQKKILINNELEKYCLANATNIYSLEKNIQKAGDKFKAFAKANKEKGIVEEFVNALNKVVLIYDGGVLVPLGERIVAEDNKQSFGVLASDLWIDIGTTPSSEGGIKFSNGKKPERLLHRIITMTTKENDLVLDYHLGSGTTAAVAHKLNRRYIGIEQMDYGENDSTVRLLNVIQGDKTGISKNVQWQGGGHFIYTELAKNNIKYLSEIEAITTLEEALAMYDKLSNSEHRFYLLNNDYLIKNRDAYKNLDLATQKKLLKAFLDRNELYIHYAEMNDCDYSISEIDKNLTNKFYNLKS